jgi:hypothetical protein
LDDLLDRQPIKTSWQLYVPTKKQNVAQGKQGTRPVPILAQDRNVSSQKFYVFDAMKTVVVLGGPAVRIRPSISNRNRTHGVECANALRKRNLGDCMACHRGIHCLPYKREAAEDRRDWSLSSHVHRVESDDQHRTRSIVV